ncbi:MAG TPA: rRNA maturation RNase YbeY, partial [Terriglobales bacterium]|nr:rRNA maturation RNase YbeY [Terriglobales bacterium]
WPLGDIILALGTCRKEARAQRKSLEQHLAHLVIHGVLHLLGYDHDMDAEAERMEGLEIAALKRLGIDNPYVTM